jgi:CheY-like chemotaxis protein
LSSGTVLLVDNEAAVQSAENILGADGYSVLTAGDSRETLRLLETRPNIDLVAASLTLPGGESGAALIGKIRLCYRSMAVMLITPALHQRLDPAVPLLLQPFTPSGLLDRVAQLLEENRFDIAALESTVERHHAMRDEVRQAQESLADNVRRSRLQRADRFCRTLRAPGVTPPLVLVVEDNFVLRYAICRFLTQQGFTVLAAASGEEALEISRAHTGPIDLLLTDFRMGAMTGLDLIDAMVLDRPDTRTLVMSGDDLHLSRPALRKPFEMQDLLVEIATILITSLQL